MAYHSYHSGWCQNCGMRRGADGRCSNCDPWWTSPLVMVGGPVVALAALMITIVIIAWSPRQAGLLSAYTAYSDTARRNGPLSPELVAPAYVPRGLVFPSTAPPLAALNPGQIVAQADPQAYLFADLERLRGMVWAADVATRSRWQASGMEVAVPSYEMLRRGEMGQFGPYRY